jgi:membrane protein YqaA with SNARE-associated domain
MTSWECLLVAYAVVFVMNVAPAFMPATWLVVAFFLIVYHVPFWPLCVGCALAATGGRCVLTLLSKRWGQRLLSAKQRQNVAALGAWLNKKSGWSQALAVLVYSLGPIPSNQMFMAAGLANVKLALVAAGFFAGRIVSYPFFASTAKGVNDHFDNIFIKEWKDPRFIILELLSLAGVCVFAHIDWPRLLHLPIPSVKSSATAGNHALLQIRAPGGAGSRVHRDHVRRGRGPDGSCHRGSRRGGRADRGSWPGRAGTTEPGAGEPDQVRGGTAPQLVWHILGRRGSRSGLARQ